MPVARRGADGVREIELRASIAARTGSLREALDLLLAAADRAESADAETIALADAVHATLLPRRCAHGIGARRPARAACRSR